MNTTEFSQKLRLSAWAEKLREQKDSGLSVNLWCMQNNISRNQFFYWKRKVKEAYLESTFPGIIQVNLPAADNSPKTSTTLATSSQTIQPGSEPVFSSCALPSLTLRMDGISFDVNRDTPPDLITLIVKAVRNA